MDDSDSSQVISGMPYVVIEVDGRVPKTLSDFTGDVHFVAEGPSTRCHIIGVGGVPTHAEVHFNDKAGPNGRDIRIWQVTQPDADGSFRAVPISNF